MQEFLDYKVLDNTILDYILFLIALVACWTVIRIAAKIFMRHFGVRADPPAYHQIVRDIGRYLCPAAYFAAFYMCTKLLKLSPALEKIVAGLAIAIIVVMGAVFISSVAVFAFNRYWESKRKDEEDLLAARFISGLIKIVVWGIAILLFLDNVGVKVTSLVAGLGISGIAVAFAAQTVLTDVFCFFTILFDRPFEIGDFIEAGDKSGTVEHIGVKTTRLRALSGEQLIFSNKDLTSSRIQNYKTMEQRRVLFTLGVTYDTPPEKLKEIPDIMKNIVEGIADTKFSRCHFVTFGEYGLNFETAYIIMSSDYDKYMDIHQQVNLSIKEIFDQNGIEFAVPAQLLKIPGTARPPVNKKLPS
ncbi:mechanosensitive ion channel family protein [Sporobacter termitidis]|nr:mechanosensitive ion channel family protein [Sporobacter termitidis]